MATFEWIIVLLLGAGRDVAEVVAEIAFDAPDRDQYLRRHAVLRRRSAGFVVELEQLAAPGIDTPSRHDVVDAGRPGGVAKARNPVGEARGLYRVSGGGGRGRCADGRRRRNALRWRERCRRRYRRRRC